MKNYINILSLLLVLTSCNWGEDHAEKSDSMSKKSIEIKRPRNTLQPYRAFSNDNERTGTQIIQYSDLTIVMEKIDMGWDDMDDWENDSIYTTDKDTAYFNLFPGEWFYDKKFKVEQSEYDKIELYEKVSYEMAMHSNQEIDVPFCVIYNWKTYESEWNKIQLDKNELKFMSNEEWIDAEIHFTVEEYKSAVKDRCGIEWYNEIKHIKSIEKLPSELFTTSYIFKIVAQNSKTGGQIVKYIVFNTPTSC